MKRFHSFAALLQSQLAAVQNFRIHSRATSSKHRKQRAPIPHPRGGGNLYGISARDIFGFDVTVERMARNGNQVSAFIDPVRRLKHARGSQAMHRARRSATGARSMDRQERAA